MKLLKGQNNSLGGVVATDKTTFYRHVHPFPKDGNLLSYLNNFSILFGVE